MVNSISIFLYLVIHLFIIYTIIFIAIFLAQWTSYESLEKRMLLMPFRGRFQINAIISVVLASQSIISELYCSSEQYTYYVILLFITGWYVATQQLTLESELKHYVCVNATFHLNIFNRFRFLFFKAGSGSKEGSNSYCSFEKCV